MTKCQILTFPVLGEPPLTPHLETISFAVCHQKSYTFHTFPPQVAKFPLSEQSDKLSLCQEKLATISLYIAIPTADRATAFRKIQFTSLATEQTIWWAAKRARGVIYPRTQAWIYSTTMLLRPYKNSSG